MLWGIVEQTSITTAVDLYGHLYPCDDTFRRKGNT